MPCRKSHRAAKASSAGGSQQGSMICLSDLPTGALANVSSYLAAPSRALFAVALNSRDVDSSSAIAGDGWEYLDFEEIEKDLAAKLTDVDIRDVLLSIDAVNNLRSLWLTNCIHITGVGLDPLRGSTIIQQIDLSLAGDHKSPKLDPEPPISCADVLPILDSIIERGEECSLEHLQLPKYWRKERNTESDFHAFLTRYNDYLSSRAVVCLRCNENLSENNEMIYMANDSEYGTQNFTCYDCMKHYCHDCVEEDEDAYCMSSMCDKCNKRYCLNCIREKECTACNLWYCMHCSDMKECFECGEDTCLNCVSETSCPNECCVDKIWCNNCVRNENAMKWCDKCNHSYCVYCCDSDVLLDGAQNCDDCDQYLCGQCRMKTCREGGNCIGCYQIAFKALTEDKESLRNENKELRSENNELKRKIRDGA